MSASNKNKNSSLDNLLNLFSNSSKNVKKTSSSSSHSNNGSSSFASLSTVVYVATFLLSFFALGFAIINAIYIAELNKLEKKAAVPPLTNMAKFSSQERTFLFAASIIMAVVFFINCVVMLKILFYEK